MIVFGYAKQMKLQGDGSYQIQTRIPSIHGPYKESDSKGKRIRNYTADEDLPWIPTVLLPYNPADGDILVISTLDETPNNWIVIGLTGASYNSGMLIE